MSVMRRAPDDTEKRQRRVADPVDLQRLIGRALGRAGIHRVRTGMRPRPGYVIFGGGTDGKSAYAVLRYSTDDDVIVRRCGRILRNDGFLMTYFVHEGRPLLRVESDGW